MQESLWRRLIKITRGDSIPSWTENIEVMSLSMPSALNSAESYPLRG